MQCYFDGSDRSGSDGRRWLTLAGFVGPDHFWKAFEKEWSSDVLQRREPHAPCLHTTDLVSGNGDYRGWSAQRRDALITDALNYLQGLPKQTFRAVVCTISTTAREKLLREGYTIGDPHVICGECALGLAYDWYFESHHELSTFGRIIFDRGEKFMHPLRQRWERKKKEEKSSLRTSFWSLIASIDASESRTTPGIQAADLLAWAAIRQCAQAERYSRLAEITRKVIPHSWLMLDENTLRSSHRLGAGDSSRPAQ